MSVVARVLLCSMVGALAQNLKGSEVAGSSSVEKLDDMEPQVLHEDLPKRHPPTTTQAFEAIALIFLIPGLGLILMKKSKDAGWEGAFGMICGLITCLWIYTAVLAFL